MARINTKRFFATAVGILILIGLVTFMASMVTPSEDMGINVFIGCLVLIPMSLYYWEGPGQEKINISSVGGWFGIFLVGFFLTGIFFLMDCGTGFLFHTGTSSCKAGMKGFGFIFTLIAGGVTLMAAAGVIRALLLSRLK